MKQAIFVFTLLALGLAASLQAQPALNPANAVAASTPLYLQIKADETSLEALDGLFHVFARFGDMPLPPEMNFVQDAVNPSLDVTFAAVDVETDVLPWLGDSIGMAVFGSLEVNPQQQPPTEYALALPIADAAGAQAFVERVAGEAVGQVGGADVYAVELSYLAVSAQTIWIGSPGGVERTLNELAEGSLAADEGYNRVRSHLLSDALIAGYVDGDWLRAQTATLDESAAPGFPSAATLFEAALRIHPAQSEMEAAILQMPEFVGAGFTLDYLNDELNLNGAAVIDSTYAAPPLTTGTAGAALLDLVPANSAVVFDSYDLSLLALPWAGVYLGAPATMSTFSNIISSLQDPNAPTPTPTPTPTPVPPPTADELVSQAQPFIAQVETVLGMSLQDLYSLINGEYAFAIFPAGETVQPGYAFWMQSPDPERLLELRDQLQLFLGLSGGAVQTETVVIGEVEVNFVRLPNTTNRLAYGVLRANILFFTTESSLSVVLDAAADETSITQSGAFPGAAYASFGTGQDAMLYADLSGYAALMNAPADSAPQIGRMIVSLDVAADGVVQARAVLTPAQP